MYIYLPILLIALLVAARLRYLYHKNVSLKYRFELVALRDRLRMLVIEEKVDSDDKVFELIDGGITTAMNTMDRITIWSAIGVALNRRLSAKAIEVEKKLTPMLAERPELKSVSDEFGQILIQATLEKHQYSIIGLLPALIPIVGSISFVRNLRNTTRKNILSMRFIAVPA